MIYQHIRGPLVYFVQAEMPEGLIKIGYTESFNQRFASLCSENACRLLVLGVHLDDEAKEIEQKLLGQFAEYRHHDKWFSPVPLLLEHIRKHATLPTASTASQMELVSDDDEDFDALARSASIPSLITIPELAKIWDVSPVKIRRLVKTK